MRWVACKLPGAFFVVCSSKNVVSSQMGKVIPLPTPKISLRCLKMRNRMGA